MKPFTQDAFLHSVKLNDMVLKVELFIVKESLTNKILKSVKNKGDINNFEVLLIVCVCF